MIEARRAQLNFGEGLIAEEIGDLWEDWMRPAAPASWCSIPAGAKAYSVNVTVVPQEGLGYLTMWPTGGARPLVSTLNSPDGRIVANAAIVPAGPSGVISVFVTNRPHVILDINGYFAP